EFKARILETDESPPVPHGAWWYYHRTVEGLEYDIHCRRAGGPGGPEGPEQVLVDENELAGGRDYFDLRVLETSPSHTLVAYGVNFDGGDRTDLCFRDLDTGEDLPDVIAGVDEQVAWVDDGTVLYVAFDAALRPWQAWRHRLGQPREADELLYQEDVERFRVEVERTKSGAFVVVSTASYETTECRVLDTRGPDAGLRMVEPRQEGRRYAVDHHGDRFLIVTNDGGAVNYKLVEAPLDSPGAAGWRDLVPARDDARLHGIEVFRHWVVLAEQSRAVPRLRVMSLADGSVSEVGVPEEVSSTKPGPNPEFDRDVLRFVYTSLSTPRTTYDLDLATGERTLVKRQPVRGPFDPSWYRTERLWATAADGTRVPMSVVYRDGTPLDGSAPAVLYGYGSYEVSIDPEFSPFLLSLLDRGVVYAIAHVRGGGELGRRWYEAGKFLDKPNTFGDFVACAKHLVCEGYASPAGLVALGASAGGLLVTAAANLRPDLFRAVVALVPFVDVVTTMLDGSIPLTVNEFEEWGDPRRPDFYACMKSYSPYDNVEAKDYPAMLVTTGLNDNAVGFWEPAKWVAKLRATKTDDHPLLLWTDLESGHGGPSGRYGEWRERAFFYAFILHAVGVEDAG
ncbi:MAG TPA: S9 family peptidase, partial [Acidimicrobiales bacterium]|nr:S9 family peptidase [Acidimicrobiales bacterium]